MKKVLVPLAILPQTDAATPLHFVRETYVKKLAKHSLLPIFVSSASPREVADELYALTDGLFYTGGSDFDSAHYGETPHPKTHIKEPARDKLEIYLLKRALHDKKPFLGICRGCQALAIASGGSLHQHVPDIADGENHDPAESYDGIRSAEKH